MQAELLLFHPSPTKFIQIEDDIAHVFHNGVGYLSSIQEDIMKNMLSFIIVLFLINPLMGQNITVTANPELAEWDIIDKFLP